MISLQQPLFSMVKNQNISSKIRNKTWCPLLPLLFNIVLEVLAYSYQWRKINKSNPDQERSSNALTVCIWHDMHIENPKYSSRKLLELISEFSKVSGYKINTEKRIAFLYTNNEKSAREIKESISFTIARKWIKYLGINLPKDIKGLYKENYKIIMKKQRLHKQMER